MQRNKGKERDMRDVRFRGMDKDGKWWEGNLIKYADGDVVISGYRQISPRVRQYVMENVLPETVGQWTGLMDKNDTKIWEGDIIERRWGDDTIKNLIEVRWTSKNDWNISPALLGSISRSRNGAIAYGFAVIGNIHEQKGGE
jgi:uncharacterized phage protein (TIGR01671 family)